MTTILLILPDKDLEAVVHAQRLALVVLPRLHGDRAGRHVRELVREGEHVGPHLLQQLLLDGGERLLLIVGGRHDLALGDHHLSAELEAHDLVLFATIAVRRDHLAVHLSKQFMQ